MRPLAPLAAVLVLALPSLAARADVQVLLTQKTRSGRTVPLAGWSASHAWKWIQAEGAVPVLQSLITLVPPETLRISLVAPRSSQLQPKDAATKGEAMTPKGRALKFLLPTMSDNLTVTTADHKTIAFRLSLQEQGDEVVSEGCDAFALDLVRTDSAPQAAPSPSPSASPAPAHAAAAPKPRPRVPFYLGFHCAQGKQGIVMTITAPKDVSWGSTTIFETAGKGEQWRQYLAGKAVNGSKGEIGRLSFTYAGASSQYQIIDRKAAAADTLEGSEYDDRIIRVRLGGGLGRLGVGTPRVSGSEYHLGLSADAETRRFFGWLKAQLVLDLATPLASGSEGGDFFDIQVSAKPAVQWGSFTFSPGLFFISALGHYANGTQTFQYNDPGLGLEIRWYRPRGSTITLSLATSGYLPSSPNTFLSLGAAYRFPQPTFGQNWVGKFGLDLQYRQMGLADPTGATDTMSEGMLNLVWSI